MKDSAATRCLKKNFGGEKKMSFSRGLGVHVGPNGCEVTHPW